MRVFLVDDDPITISLIAFILSEEGIETQYALSAKADNFYENLVEFNPDVIILDIYLREEQGFQIASKIKSLPSLKHTSIVAISGSSLLKDKMKAFSSGFIEYLEKPFSKNELVKVIKRHGHFHEVLSLCDKILKRQELNNDFFTIIDKKA